MVHYHHSLKSAGKEGADCGHGNRHRHPQTAFVSTIGYCLILAFSQRDMEALHSERKKLRGFSPRTIPTERPPLVGEVSANFSG
jgi:hypothetical protein